VKNQNKNMSYTVVKPSKRKSPYFWGAMALALVVCVVAVLELTNTTRIFHKRSVTVNTPTTGGGSANEQKGEPQTNTSSSSMPTDTAQPGDNKSDSGGSSTASVITPSGSFVSAHGTSEHPVPLSASLASVCNTTPGVSCKITFTSTTGITKSLDAETTDRGGSAYWNSWTPASIGLSAGTWQVKAVATSGSQTKTASYAMDLVLSS
jgi:hypothetical protein